MFLHLEEHSFFEMGVAVAKQFEDMLVDGVSDGGIVVLGLVEQSFDALKYFLGIELIKPVMVLTIFFLKLLLLTIINCLHIFLV